jgi:hypothetical protein
MAPRVPHDDGDSQPPYESKETSARTRQPRQLSFRQAPALLRLPRHHTNRVPKPLRTACTQGTSSSPLDTLAHCYISHCTPGPSPYAYKRKVQGPLTKGWPRGEGRDGARVSLSLSPTRTLVTPYCKRTRPGRGTNTKAAGFPFYAYLPPAFPPPSRSVSRRPIWAGARGDNLLVGPGTPRVRNADSWCAR